MDETGSSWTNRFYTCTFCNRGFSSAQALGGHMNVHRKDRARLRQCSSQSRTNSQLSIPTPGAQAGSLRSPGITEDQISTAYKDPISGNCEPILVSFSRNCSPSRSSRVLHGSVDTHFSDSTEHHGGSLVTRVSDSIEYFGTLDSKDSNKQVNMEGTGDGLDLELRLGK